MSYTIDESRSDPEFTPAELVRQTFGTDRRIESIGVHHWGAFGQTHDGVLNFFQNVDSDTSAHFVASGLTLTTGRINCIVSPVNAAWAAGNAYGNATAVHIELHPEATDADYACAAWLVNWIRENYGRNLPLIPHRQWHATACPGKWDLARLDRMARDLSGAPATPAPAPAPARKTYPDSAIHWVVERGDTLSKIAAYYNGPSVAAIAAHNGIDPNRLAPGDKVWIPGRLVWTIEAPDTIRSVAKYYGVDPTWLAKFNGLPGPDSTIFIGNTLVVQ